MHLPRCLLKLGRFGWLWIKREAKFKVTGLHRECLVNDFPNYIYPDWKTATEQLWQPCKKQRKPRVLKDYI